jgi:hypothetical protein
MGGCSCPQALEKARQEKVERARLLQKKKAEEMKRKKELKRRMLEEIEEQKRREFMQQQFEKVRGASLRAIALAALRSLVRGHRRCSAGASVGC